MDTRRCKVQPATEAGFDLRTCFNRDSLKEDGYIKDSDYYFDSYSHFSMYPIKF